MWQALKLYNKIILFVSTNMWKTVAVLTQQIVIVKMVYYYI